MKHAAGVMTWLPIQLSAVFRFKPDLSTQKSAGGGLLGLRQVR